MAREDAAPLITLADKISHEGPCAQARDIRALRARRNALINARRVPPALQEPLSAGVNALIEPVCLRPVPAVTVTPPAFVPDYGGKGGDNQGHQGDGGGGD